jgi:hypothetical protein
MIELFIKAVDRMRNSVENLMLTTDYSKGVQK